MAWLDGTLHMEINEITNATEGIFEMNKIGAKITYVSKNRTQGMITDCELERAIELVDNGWEWG